MTTTQHVTLEQQRADFLKEMGERCYQIIDSTDADAWRAVIKTFTDATGLGRSPKWQNACRWFQVEINESDTDGTGRNVDHLRWIALQGSVWMAHAS